LSRKQRQLSYSQKQFNQVREMLKAVDVVLEVIDARAPYSTKTRNLVESSRKHMLVLHKTDLAREHVTSQWEAYFRESGVRAIPYHSRLSAQYLTAFLKEYRSSQQFSRFKRPLRLMVAGMPNVGKSTLVNLLLRKKVSRTGNRPGITRGNQWVRINPHLEMLDTPGVLLPVVAGKFSFNCLSALGILPANRYDDADLGNWLLEMLYLRNIYPAIEKRYGIHTSGITDREELLATIGQARGCLAAGGEIDLHTAARLLIKDFQEGALGPVSLELPGEEEFQS